MTGFSRRIVFFDAGYGRALSFLTGKAGGLTCDLGNFIVASLAEILRCPLHPDSSDTMSSLGSYKLRCNICGSTYPLSHGIIDMLGPSEQMTPFLESESHQWDRHAPIYDEHRTVDLIYMNCVRAGILALRRESGDMILDAGCGTGVGTRMLHDSTISIVALDLSFRSLKHLREAVSLPEVHCVRADISKLPFPAKVFDRLICANTIQHIPSWNLRRACVNEFARVVKTGGTVVVTV